MMSIGAILSKMLQENVGMSLLDSGGTPVYDTDGRYLRSEHGYGRQYERNRGKDFEAEPPVTWKFSVSDVEGWPKWDVEIDFSAYHWLKKRLDPTPELQKKFREFCREHKDMECLEAARKFAGRLCPYGQRSLLDTAHDSNLLDHEFQCLEFDYEDESYVLLSIHLGCDRRGGYGTPRVFNVLRYGPGLGGYDQASIYGQLAPDRQPALIELQEFQPQWTSNEGGYLWDWTGDKSVHADNLEAYKASENPADRGRGKLYIDTQGAGYCPLTGTPLSIGW